MNVWVPHYFLTQTTTISFSKREPQGSTIFLDANYDYQLLGKGSVAWSYFSHEIALLLDLLTD
jgi:hypothetical protein